MSDDAGVHQVALTNAIAFQAEGAVESTCAEVQRIGKERCGIELSAFEAFGS